MAKIQNDLCNVRIHNQKNQKAIHESLKKNGTGRSILVDSENVIIGGNGVYDEAQKLGLPVRIIESDGTELIAIKRTDLKTNDAKRKALAIADNRCADLSTFNDEKLAQMIKDISDTDFSGSIGFNQDEINKILKNSGAFIPEKPEVEFAEELLECHNYIVLYFDNDIDWLQAQSLFAIKTVKDSKMFGKSERRGIGRVLRGADAINRLLGSTK